jgi:multidrug efflux system membrane fusion protein
VDKDQGVVQLDQGNLDAAKVNVDYTRIDSPIDGRVGLRLVDPGNIVPANGTTGLLVITQLQPITVVFSVAEDYLSSVTSQMRAGNTLRVDALDRDQEKEIARGTLLTIDNQIDTTTGTVKMKATFPNGDNALFPNEFVNAKLLVRTFNSVNLIPMAAIQHNNDVAYVYVIKSDGTAQSRNVKVATTDGETAAVTGVAPGEVVTTDGFDKLQDGVKVMVRPAAAPKAQPAQSSE